MQANDKQRQARVDPLVIANTLQLTNEQRMAFADRIVGGRNLYKLEADGTLLTATFVCTGFAMLPRVFLRSVAVTGFCLTPPVGFEPTTGCLEGSCSIQLS